MTERFSESQFYRDRVQQRRKATKAVAFIERGKWAGIPEKHLRIKQDEFRKLLYDNFYGGAKQTKELVEYVYVHPENICNTSFITIDGGDVPSRKKAGYTLMFRIILCNKWGYHVQCSHLLSLFQAGFAKDLERAETIKDLQKYDVLFISEINQKIVDSRAMIGSYFDEILDTRADRGKVTIISFASPISQSSRLGAEFGDYLDRLSSAEKSCEDILRIRVRKTDA